MAESPYFPFSPTNHDKTHPTVADQLTFTPEFNCFITYNEIEESCSRN
jgi:hypothetical protein